MRRFIDTLGFAVLLVAGSMLGSFIGYTLAALF